jgi:hypothetical protein
MPNLAWMLRPESYANAGAAPTTMASAPNA